MTKKDEKEPGKLQSMVDSVKGAAHGAVEGVKNAKGYVVDKAAKPAEAIEDIKEWGAEKAKQADSMLDKLEIALARVGDAITQLREWASEKAEQVDRTLETSAGVISNAEQTLGQAHDWAREKAV